MITDGAWISDGDGVADGAPTTISRFSLVECSEPDAAQVSRRLARLEMFKSGIEELKRETGVWTGLDMNDQSAMGDSSDQAIARAAANIALWRTYLPEDCVAAMIAAGWHWST